MDAMDRAAKVIFLHHSTGGCIWNGGVADWFERYNAANGTAHHVTETAFPKAEPYGWRNYPYDYWNIWVRNAGAEPFQSEPTLELLTADYDVIVLKHCFPVSHLEPDTEEGDAASDVKSDENYRLQYAALKRKMHEFPDTRFLVWTGAALVAANSSEEEAARARAFFAWVRDEWDEPGDNIFVWDFFELQTEGGCFLKPGYAAGETDPHPNAEFSANVAPFFAQRIVDVIEGTADETAVTGAPR
jgi:hypothetical protein